jgi:hypothetical protein
LETIARLASGGLSANHAAALLLQVIRFQVTPCRADHRLRRGPVVRQLIAGPLPGGWIVGEQVI